MSAPWNMRPLTAMRLLAALHVIYLHEMVSSWAGAPAIVQTLLARTAAVSLFFFISGFVMVHAHHAYGARGPLTFLVARLARVYPLYLVGLALFLPFYAHRLATGWWDGLGAAHGIKAFLVNVFLLQAWFPENQWYVNLPGWTVSAFFFCYLTFPLVQPLLARLDGVRLLELGLLAYVVSQLLVAAFAGGAFGTDEINVLWKNPLVRWPEFLLGMVAGTAFWKGAADWAWLRHPATFPLSGLATLGLFVALPAAFDPYIHNGLLLPMMAVMVMSSLFARGAATRGLEAGWIQRLGEASFTLYILHLPIANMLSWAMRGVTFVLFGEASTARLGPLPDAFWSTQAFIAVELMVLVPVALWVHRAIEAPARVGIKQGWSRVVAASQQRTWRGRAMRRHVGRWVARARA